MPIDKGGKHMLANRRVPYEAPENPIVSSTSSNPISSFYVCEPTQLYSICVLNIKGTRDPDKQYLTMEDGNDYYTIPVTGKIQSISTEPQNLNIGLAKGIQLTKDEKLAFSTDLSDSAVYITLVLLCTLVKDDL
jgi:hypothetical protein